MVSKPLAIGSTFGVEVTFRSADSIEGIRENDSSLMTEFFRIGYRNKQLELLNIVRRYWNLLHLSDISKCDGKSLDTFVLSDMAETSVQYTFPQEEPASKDFTLWKEAINLLCSGSTILPVCTWYLSCSATPSDGMAYRRQFLLPILYWRGEYYWLLPGLYSARPLHDNTVWPEI